MQKYIFYFTIQICFTYFYRSLILLASMFCKISNASIKHSLYTHTKNASIKRKTARESSSFFFITIFALYKVRFYCSTPNNTKYILFITLYKTCFPDLVTSFQTFSLLKIFQTSSLLIHKT